MSPAIHNAAFQALGLNYVYLAFNVEQLGGALTGMRALPGFRGMSVTIPHKQAIMEHLDVIDPMAMHIGSVNTVTCDEDGRLIGTSTDGPGTIRAFEDAGVVLKGKEVVFLGAGGAVRAVAYAMADAEVGSIRILGRNLEKVEVLVADLARDFEVPVAAGTFEADLESAVGGADILIQGTPMGMHPHHVGESVVPAALLKKDHVVFDMVYNPLRTQLIEDAEAAGCTCILGLEMLVNQALLQFETWTGVDAPRTVMRDALLAHLEGK